MTKVGNKVTNTVKFATFEPLTSTERLSTVSSPYMVKVLNHDGSKEVNCVKKGPWPFLVLKVLKQGQTGDLCITLASSTLTPPSESGH